MRRPRDPVALVMAWHRNTRGPNMVEAYASSCLVALGDHLLANGVDGVDHVGHAGRVLLAHQPSAQVGDQALGAKLGEHEANGVLDLRVGAAGLQLQQGGVEVALQARGLGAAGGGLLGDHGAHLGAGGDGVDGDDVVALGAGGDAVHGVAGEGEEGDGGVAAAHLLRDLLHRGHREVVEGGLVDELAHRLEHLDHVSAALHLLVEVVNHHAGEVVQQHLGVLGVVAAPADAGIAVVLGGAAHHVVQEGPRRRREADQGHAVPLLDDGLVDALDALEDVPEGLLHVHAVGQALQVRGGGQGVGDQDALAAGHLDVDAEGLGHHEDVGEEDGCVQVVAAEGLHGHLSDGHGVVEDLEEVLAGVLLELVVLGQMAARLAEEPHGGGLGGLALGHADHEVVLGGHVGGGADLLGGGHHHLLASLAHGLGPGSGGVLGSRLGHHICELGVATEHGCHLKRLSILCSVQTSSNRR
mmetsp:Transcript_20318/g.44472  ORF Transcript_20318/g.44472 Transcript_20318/m.44472 type:complete len:470 (-) Transcript_20318:25-1434(-)